MEKVIGGNGLYSMEDIRLTIKKETVIGELQRDLLKERMKK